MKKTLVTLSIIGKIIFGIYTLVALTKIYQYMKSIDSRLDDIDLSISDINDTLDKEMDMYTSVITDYDGDDYDD